MPKAHPSRNPNLETFFEKIRQQAVNNPKLKPKEDK